MEQKMNLLEFIMLIIGIITIIMSCIIVAWPNKENDRNINSLDGSGNLFTKEELESFIKQQNEMLSIVSEEVIEKTEDYLSKLSNEKIIAVSEYSDQILDKITRNHEEVVFLYNMLTNKEKDLKDAMKKYEVLEKKENELVLEDQDLSEQKSKPMESKQLGMQADNIKLKARKNSPSQSNEIDTINQSVSFNNGEILELCRQGKSVLEISKQLGIGQGEVKLVIDLFMDR